jgi:hypothetical protein
MFLLPEIPSSNVFIQPALRASQFRVLETVPDIIQQVGANANQHNASHIAGTAAIEIEDAAQAADALNTELIAPAPEVLNTSGLASTSISMLAEAPQAAEPTLTPPTGPTTSTPQRNPTSVKALLEKRYLRKSKMSPGVSITAR